MEAINAIAQIARSQGRGPTSTLVDRVLDALIPALATERDPEVVGVIARSLGRIARNDATGERVREALGTLSSGNRPLEPSRTNTANAREIFGVMHGRYNLARTMRPPAGRPPVEADAVALGMLRYGLPPSSAEPARRELAAQIRRLAMLTISAANARADSAVGIASSDPDGQVRRLAVLATAGVSDQELRQRVLARALSDKAFIVRLEAVRVWRRLVPSDCAPIMTATGDSNPPVALAAIDALGSCPASTEARTVLARLAAPAPSRPDRALGMASWHTHAHAIVALARMDAPAAGPQVAADASHPVWQVRMYAARAAAVVRDVATLTRLAEDTVGGVREAAIDGLAATAGHASDDIFVRALASDQHHVVRAAAAALKGTPGRDSVLPVLVATLDRLTRTGEDNSRDPRMELLQRIGELGDRASIGSIEPYVKDYDPAVAERAAAIVSQWSGGVVAASPTAQRRVSPDLLRVASSRNVLLRFTMSPASGGGSFVVRLRTDAAPATAQRLIALSLRGYYNGLTFHRVEPTFVIQGGSPGATEYVGDSPFMRDEVDLASHTYGTLGISTRGRDTGDAQIFVNLTDNFRLDHDYTVAGDVVEGMATVDRVLEGDVIARVTVSGWGASRGAPRE